MTNNPAEGGKGVRPPKRAKPDDTGEIASDFVVTLPGPIRESLSTFNRDLLVRHIAALIRRLRETNEVRT